VPDSCRTFERGEIILSEDLCNQSGIGEHPNAILTAHSDAGTLLATVLQRE
jgi:hypothetical protein